MNPSTVRKRILKDHTALRKRLRELEIAVDTSYADASRQPATMALARELLYALIAHTEAEDAVLAPALREIDAWGPIRASMLLEHHASQRDQLRDLIARYGAGCERTRLAQLTRRWIHEVEEDMLDEETSVLSAELLKDDPVAVGMESG